MQVGINLLLWTTHVTDEHTPIIKSLKKIGYDGVEIPVMQGDPTHYQKLGCILDDIGLRRTSTMIQPDTQHNPISNDPAARQGGLDHLKWAIDCCAALGAEVLCGPTHSTLGHFSGAGATDEEKQRAVEIHQQAADYAAQTAPGLVIAIEPLNRFECYFCNTTDDGAALSRKINRPNVGVLFDTFHANIEEDDPVGCIGPNVDTIRHVHVCENNRGCPGQGHIDHKAAFAALKAGGYDGWLTIEAFGRSLPDLAAATRIWRDIFPSCEKLYTAGLEYVRSNWQQAL